MRKLLGYAACAAFLVAVAPALASAANISITPVYAQAYTPDAVNGPHAIGTPGTVQPGTIIQFDVRMTVSNLAAGENFWAAGFNVNLPSTLSKADPFGAGQMWLDPGLAEQLGLASYTYPADGSSPAPAHSYAQYRGNTANTIGSNHWQGSNGDAGIAGDLRGILVETAAAEANNRRYGEATRPGAGRADQLGSPTLLGTFFAIANATGTLTIGPSLDPTWGTFVNNSTGTGTVNPLLSQAFTGGSVVVTVVPEPATIVMMGLAGFGFVVAARHRKTA